MISCKHSGLLPLACLISVLMFSTAGAQYLQVGAKLVGTDVVGSAQQGVSVSISADGNTAIVGGPSDNSDTGAAWVYIRTGGSWTQQGTKLVGAGAVGKAYQGYAVSLSGDGNTALVGGFKDSGFVGAAWVYTRTGGVWTQQGTKLVGTGAAGFAFQGTSVSLSADGNTAIVGGTADSGSAGAAWVYTRTGGVWTQQGTKLVGTGAVDPAQQGNSVSLSDDGNTAIVGGFRDNGFAGAAWVYTRTAGVWTQQGTKLVGIDSVGAGRQGQSVSLSADGNTAIVGGPFDNSGAGGAAWVYTRTAGVWTQEGAKLVGTGNVGGAGHGTGVSLSDDGNTAFVGGSYDDGQAGAVWVYTRTAGAWTQQGAKLVGTGAVGNAFQGFSVALSADGNTAIVGGHGDNSSVGAAWIYMIPPPPSVTLTSPDGGESWNGLSSYNITWTSVSIANVKIEYSTNNGSAWILVTASTPAGTGLYAWTVPNTPTTLALVRVSDASNAATSDTSESTFTIVPTQSYSVNDKWNMISVPLTLSDYTKTAVYPTAISNAFAYEGAYTAKMILTNGVGYWLKFDGAQSIPLTGLLRDPDTMTVSEGWNLIGSISAPVNVASVTSDPPGMVTSEFFGYSGAYTASDSIDPGKAYWVKVNQAGTLTLASTSSSPANRLRIVSTGELPPAPPDAEPSSGNSIIPAEFSLHQNYPNPFNPSTVIMYEIPDKGGVLNVQLKVYDVLGQLVATLVNELQEPGYKSVEWNVADVPSGMYFYRFNAGTFSDMKKLMLIK